MWYSSGKVPHSRRKDQVCLEAQKSCGGTRVYERTQICSGNASPSSSTLSVYPSLCCFGPLFCGSCATDVDKSPKDTVSKEHSVFSALEIEASLCKHAVSCLWLLLEETLALHCTIPARHQVHERQTTGSAGILCPLRCRDHWEFCVGDRSFGASG